MEKWFVEEVHSDNGLTWKEFKGKMKAIAAERNYTPTANDWKSLRKVFNSIDKNGDGTIRPSEFAAATQ